MLDGLGYRVLNGIEIPNIRHGRETLPAALFDKLFLCDEVFFFSADDRDLGSVPRKCSSDTARDARRTAGYKRNFTL